MYDYEIQNLLEINNYNIDSETYINICQNSSQIREVKYNPYENCFEIWTNESYWKFYVYRKGN